MPPVPKKIVIISWQLAILQGFKSDFLSPFRGQRDPLHNQQSLCWVDVTDSPISPLDIKNRATNGISSYPHDR